MDRQACIRARVRPARRWQHSACNGQPMSTGTASVDKPDKRCFLALLPDPASRLRLQHAREGLERAAAGAARCVRWIEPRSLHLTLRFLGDSSALQVDHFKHVLPMLARALPPCTTHRYGIWPNRARPRLLVLELQANPLLSDCARACESHAREAGFAPETRPFRAHLTLARLRPGCVFGALPAPPPPIRFDSLALMQSTLAQPSAIHVELARTTLTQGVA